MTYVYGSGAQANYSGRVIVYPNQVPFDTDILRSDQYRMVDIANLAQAVLGLPPTIGGAFVGLSSGICTEHSPNDMTVDIGVCTLYALTQMESNAYGNLGPLTLPLLYKQFSNMVALNSGTLGTITAPSAGNWQYWMIQGTPQNSNVNPVNRPFYNASNPSSPNFATNPDTQIDRIVFDLVAGTPSAMSGGLPAIPATTGSGIGMFLILIQNGDTAISNSMISNHPSCVGTNLAQMPNAIQSGKFTYAEDTSVAANTILINPGYRPSAYTEGMGFEVLVANTNTGATTINISGLGAKSIVYTNGDALEGSELVGDGIYRFVYDGTNFQALNVSQDSNDFTRRTEINAGTGNFTVPAGVYKLRVQAWAPGGGGGGGAVGVGGGGGGSGGYSETEVNVTPGQLIPYLVSTGGAGGTTGNDGSDGAGQTTFGGSIVCNPGSFGHAAGYGGLGGTEGTGIYAAAGFAGSPGVPTVTGGTGGGFGGGTGTATGGNDARADSGSGGAGGFGVNAGGDGADGVIYVIY